jgi:RNA polymerase sigma factor (sigma-70 family)
MASVRINDVLRTLKGRLARDEAAEAADGVLLERFLARRDEAAFAELVRRHGAMVYGVCERLLRDRHDAEDAFQATFLVLVRRGSAVLRVRSVGCWLYGVARRTALEARRAAARRRTKEANAMTRRATGAAEDGCDLRDVLDTEIDRLPAKLRSPLLLCDLEGKTRKEAARHLGWQEGTVASRLAAARTTLAGRLTRRGVNLSVAVLATALAADAAGAVPPGLASSTVRVAVGQSVSSSGVSTLVKGVLMTMFLKKFKASVVIVLTALFLGAGGAVFRGVGATEARAADGVKPRSELEALRHENELLRLNLNVVLEKVHAQEAELQQVRRQLPGKAQIGVGLGGGGPKAGADFKVLHIDAPVGFVKDRQVLELTPALKGTAKIVPQGGGELVITTTPEISGNFIYEAASSEKDEALRAAAALKHAEAALLGLREAKDDRARKVAIGELEAALQALMAHQPKHKEIEKKAH